MSKIAKITVTVTVAVAVVLIAVLGVLYLSPLKMTDFYGKEVLSKPIRKIEITVETENGIAQEVVLTDKTAIDGLVAKMKAHRYDRTSEDLFGFVEDVLVVKLYYEDGGAQKVNLNYELKGLTSYRANEKTFGDLIAAVEAHGIVF